MVLMTGVKNVQKHYDILVIGAGAGLGKLGRPATEYGYKVALCEKGRLGGTCLNRGCIPSKMLIHPADVAYQIDDATRYNIEPRGYEVKFSDLVSRVNNVIDEESFGINPKVEQNPNLDWYTGTARFVDERKVQVGPDEDQVFITADRVFVVAGTRPRELSIPGLKGTPYMTSTEALRNTKPLKTLTVIGGGYISCELAHFFAATGTEVTMFVRSVFLKNEDEEVQKEYERVFSARQNVNVKMKTLPSRVSYDENNDQFTIYYKDNNTQEEQSFVSDGLLVAAGVVPNTDILQCEKAGIELDKSGFIKVDEYLKSVSASNVWALGDIAGNFLFRHSANFEAEYIMETQIAKLSEPHPIDYTGMPHAVFSNPQVAGVGLTEQECREQGYGYVVGKNPFGSSAMGMALRAEEGFCKLIIEKKTRKILGCHIIGHEASTLIHQVIPLMRLGGKLDDLLLMIHVHPALNEIIRNSARRVKASLLSSGEHVPASIRFK